MPTSSQAWPLSFHSTPWRSNGWSCPTEKSPFLDAGYWSLPKDGFKGVKLDAWEDYRAAVIDFVLRMVTELRRGVFPIASQEAKCTQFCDFHKTCRVSEVRSARKAWNDRPALEVIQP